MVDEDLMNEVQAGEFTPAETKSFRVRVSQVVHYEITVRATTDEQAQLEVQRQIDAGEGENLDLYEVDNSDFQLEEQS